MSINAAQVRALVEAGRSEIKQQRLLDAVRPLLVPPRCELREWDYGAPNTDLSGLSSSVMHVYGGMGSFNDYTPTRYDTQSGRHTAIPGTETFDEIAGRVYVGALSLRVVGHVA